MRTKNEGGRIEEENRALAIVLNTLRINIRRFRRSRGLRLRDVAEATGISLPFLSDIERGNANPSIVTLVKIASYYNLPINTLFL